MSPNLAEERSVFTCFQEPNLLSKSSLQYVKEPDLFVPRKDGESQITWVERGESRTHPQEKEACRGLVGDPGCVGVVSSEELALGRWQD